jgi:hypothetical protein
MLIVRQVLEEQQELMFSLKVVAELLEQMDKLVLELVKEILV